MKNKLFKFEQNKTFPNFFEPKLDFLKKEDFYLKSVWKDNFFKNNNSIIVELGCGKGEYSVELAKKFPQKNFIGIDIKGARMWKGANDSQEQNITNIAFVRTRIEFTPLYFSNSEISEIWITFPDPQLRHRKRIKKRLTSTIFLGYYQKFLINNGIINLKTDDDTLYNYTKEIIKLNSLEVLVDTNNLYESEFYDDILSIKTYYEKMWNKENKTIKYLRFLLPNDKILIEPQID